MVGMVVERLARYFVSERRRPVGAGDFALAAVGLLGTAGLLFEVVAITSVTLFSG